MIIAVKCLTCPAVSDRDEFATYVVGGRRYIRKHCKVCWSNKRKQSYQDDLATNRARSRKAQAARRGRPGYRVVANRDQKAYILRMRKQIESLLGCKCAACPVNDRTKLQIDHIEGGGRKEFGVLAPHQVYRKILIDPTGYQLLCANCNWRKRTQKIGQKALELRAEAIDLLGGSCACCGDNDSDVLQFHHCNHDGWLDKKQSGGSLDAPVRYKLILRSPGRFKLLCANCHSTEHRG